MKYRSKEIVEAIEWTGDNFEDVIKYIRAYYKYAIIELIDEGKTIFMTFQYSDVKYHITINTMVVWEKDFDDDFGQIVLYNSSSFLSEYELINE